MRGNRVVAEWTVTYAGPTPARAGQPSSRHSAGSRTAAYPRACGATYDFTGAYDNTRGLPPRVRGNRQRVQDGERQYGPTPARAGQPRYARAVRSVPWAYPRACGATSSVSAPPWMASGLPPRVRGNRDRHDRRHAQQGPTPARAGQPRISSSSGATTTAYPRACGATDSAALNISRSSGLPPRVRGNRGHELRRGVAPRPTPARAGQPRSRSAVRGGAGAYPRACGATVSSAHGSARYRGLPPLLPQEPRVRPTPARAGQPCRRRRSGAQSRAYPRACGATARIAAAVAGYTGLPPRVRGNPGRIAGPVLRHGPTPARAGQPEAVVVERAHGRAYPRACGATRRARASAWKAAGLPPRVRGNRVRHAGLAHCMGPTPARAGQPESSDRAG